MDSSLLVAMLCRKLKVKDLPTFTIGLNYQRFDEAPAAREVAQLFGTQHHEDRVSPDMIALLPDLITALDEPSDPLSLCTWLLAKFTRQHVKVVIGGDGGDELFGGYDRYYGNMYAAHYGKVPGALAPQGARAGDVADPGIRLVQERRPSAALAASSVVSQRRRSLRREPVVFLFRSRTSSRAARTAAREHWARSTPKRRSARLTKQRRAAISIACCTQTAWCVCRIIL